MGETGKILSDFDVRRVFNSRMMMTESQELLADYVKSGSETSFRELVARHIDLVYSTALRLVGGDSHRAEDVAQTVLVDLARGARALSKETRVSGWLHRHTCFVAAKVMRGERRRQAREREAVEMNALNDGTDAGLSELAPVLDDAINQLGEEDRAAILLRFFERRDLRSVGAALGTTEDAAQKRVSRALEKLHVTLRHRGVTLSTAALATLLGTAAVTAAPAGLAATLAGAALASAAANAGFTFALFKGVTAGKLMAGLLGAVAVASLTASLVVVRQQSRANLRAPDASLRRRTELESNQAPEIAGRTGASHSQPTIRLVGESQRSAPTVGPVVRSGFEVILSGNQWHIKVTFGGNTNYFEECAYDGRECKYGLFDAPGDFDPSQPADTRAHWLGLIHRSAFPTIASAETQLLCLALGSSDFLAHDRTGSMPAPWVPDGALGERYFAYEASVFGRNGGLPRSLTLRASAKLARSEREKRRANPFLQPLPDGARMFDFPDGFRAAEFKVLSSTNIQGTIIPLSFEMNRFAAVGGFLGLSTGSYLFAKYTARVTSLEVITREDNAPKIFKVPQAAILDYRFEDDRHPGLYLRWSPVPDSWPAADGPEVRALVAKARQDYEAAARDTSRRQGRVPRNP
jgi:RNA polymerase sigma factor (sigma-70 family)